MSSHLIRFTPNNSDLTEKQNKTWTLVDNKVGEITIALPDNFNELLAVVKINDGAYTVCIPIIKDILTSDLIHINGGSANSNSTFRAQVSVNTSSIRLTSAGYDGANYIANSRLIVYYR